MAENPIKTPLPANLPEDWTAGQIVAPTGEEVGLTKQHGYNYLMQMVNRAQQGVNAVGEAFETVSGKRTCRVVVGTSTAGWTKADCDFLCDGVDDQVEIQRAINAIPSGGGEVVILDGQYHLTGGIEIGYDVNFHGNGAGNTLLWRDAASVGDLNRKDPIIVIYGGTLSDLWIGASVDAPDATQVYMLSGGSIIRANINISDVNSMQSRHKIGMGVYVDSAPHGSDCIKDCIFGNVGTAIYLNIVSGGMAITGCRSIHGELDGTYIYPRYFIQCSSQAYISRIFVLWNLFDWSILQIDGFEGIYIIENTFARLEISKWNSIESPKWGGNLAANNILAVLEANESDAGIFLSQNTHDWFVTGNQVRKYNSNNEYWPIEDNGINNIVRFNSNDTSAGGTVGPAGPGVPAGGTSGQMLVKKSATNYDTQWVDPPASGGGSGGVTMEEVEAAIAGKADKDELGNFLYSGQGVNTVALVTQSEYDSGEKDAKILYLVKE